jgi:hypothetical protein
MRIATKRAAHAIAFTIARERSAARRVRDQKSSAGF